MLCDPADPHQTTQARLGHGTQDHQEAYVAVISDLNSVTCAATS